MLLAVVYFSAVLAFHVQPVPFLVTRVFEAYRENWSGPQIHLRFSKLSGVGVFSSGKIDVGAQILVSKPRLWHSTNSSVEAKCNITRQILSDQSQDDPYLQLLREVPVLPAFFVPEECKGLKTQCGREDNEFLKAYSAVSSRVFSTGESWLMTPILDFVNHNFSGNTKLVGEQGIIFLIATREILAGEEITYRYTKSFVGESYVMDYGFIEEEGLGVSYLSKGCLRNLTLPIPYPKAPLTIMGSFVAESKALCKEKLPDVLKEEIIKTSTCLVSVKHPAFYWLFSTKLATLASVLQIILFKSNQIFFFFYFFCIIILQLGISLLCVSKLGAFMECFSALGRFHLDEERKIKSATASGRLARHVTSRFTKSVPAAKVPDDLKWALLETLYGPKLASLAADRPDLLESEAFLTGCMIGLRTIPGPATLIFGEKIEIY